MDVSPVSTDDAESELSELRKRGGSKSKFDPYLEEARKMDSGQALPLTVDNDEAFHGYSDVSGIRRIIKNRDLDDTLTVKSAKAPDEHQPNDDPDRSEAVFNVYITKE